MISFNNLSKSYGNRVLFESVTFTLNPRERLGLVGRNGHGKTTLLNIITGQESPDSGEIIVPKNYKVGYLTQIINFKKATVVDEAVSALPDDKKDSPYLAEKILSGLGFDQDMIKKSPMELSGGYQVRLNLAKLLLSEPNLLIMDEPTNYLDILSVIWLENFLLQWKGELIFVTHDRSFMDKVATHIAGIHRQKIRKMAGATDKYYAQIAQDEEIYEKTRLNDEAKRKDMEEYITKFRAKARMAGMVQSRVKTLSKMEKKDKLTALAELEFSFKYKDIVSDTVIQATDIGYGYTDQFLFKNLSFTLDKGDKIGIIGKNGAGKSTLLRLLSGNTEPRTGKVMKGQGIEGGYFEQTNISRLPAESTVEDEISAAGDYKLDRTQVRNICASMLFTGDDALKKIKILSGGEKCRVMLGKILARQNTYLLLDEPTNHLDMDAADSLLEALTEFDGPVAIVTHNETFLHALASKLIVFQGEPHVFEGTYAEFLEKEGWLEADNRKESKNDKSVNKKDLRKMKADLVAEKSRIMKPLNDRAEKIEIEIIELEEGVAVIHKGIETATAERNGQELTRLGNALQEAEDKINTLYDELNEITVEIDSKQKEFDRKMEEIV